MKPSAVNAFEHTRVPYGDDGRLVRGIIARCGNCEAAVPLVVNTMTSHSNCDEVEWQYIAKKLEAKGWRIGKSRTSHRCPKCFKAAKFAAIRKSDAAAVAMSARNEEIAMQVVENARVMSREDRRIIFDKLNQVYIDAKIGYAPGWTDEKVATDLGVPRGWVRLLRDENFGDEMSNEDIRASVAEAQSILKEIRTFQHSFDPEVRRLYGLADKIEKSLAEIQRVLK